MNQNKEVVQNTEVVQMMNMDQYKNMDPNRKMDQNKGRWSKIERRTGFGIDLLELVDVVVEDDVRRPDGGTARGSGFR